MTSRFTPYKPRSRFHVDTIPTDYIPHGRGITYGITSRKVITEDNDEVYEECVYRGMDPDPLVKTTGTGVSVQSNQGRMIQTMHIVTEILQMNNPRNPLFQYFMEYDPIISSWIPRSIDVVIYDLHDDELANCNVEYRDQSGTIKYLTYTSVNRLKIVACFCWYLIYLYDRRQEDFDLTRFRHEQYADFLVSVYRDNMPLMTIDEWKINRINLVMDYIDQKEADLRDLAKKRSPANEFQRQIKFDPKQYPVLKDGSEYQKWKRDHLPSNILFHRFLRGSPPLEYHHQPSTW